MNRQIKNLISIITVISFSIPSMALDIFGRPASGSVGQGTKRGLVALYLFNQDYKGVTLANDIIADESGVGTPLDLKISDTNAIKRVCTFIVDPSTGLPTKKCYLDFIYGSKAGVASIGPADKITNQCKSSNELTIEAWVRNDRADELTKEGRMMPLKIMTLGRPVGTTAGGRYVGSSNDANFYLGLDYDNAAQYTAGARIGARDPKNAGNKDGFQLSTEASKYAFDRSIKSLNTPDTSTEKVLIEGKLQQLVYTYSQTNGGKFYASSVSDGSGSAENPFELLPSPRASGGANGPDNPFAGWGSGFYLGLGNEVTFNETGSNVPVFSSNNITFRTENREWRGELHMLAIYCNAHTDKEILGNAAPGAIYSGVAPDPNVNITPNHIAAAQLYTRLVGVKIPVTAPIINQMAIKLASGDKLGAASLATQEDGFYNITVRDFAKRMSTRDETVNTPLNDFVATIIGVARDIKDARQLLTGNFFYMADRNLASVPSNMENDILRSNNHYASLEDQQYNLRKVLKKVDGQLVFNGSGIVSHPDPAGVITSRAFMAAHSVAGTNRRLVEYTFREFACVPMAQWADASGPDNYIGRDVDRIPGGNNNTFLTTCRGCHSNMDGLRQAFAKYNFADGFVKYAPFMPVTNNPDNENATNMCQNPVGIACKMNRNSDMFPGGYATYNDSWINNANRGSNATFFGWVPDSSGKLTGNGARGLGQMLSKSAAFPRCMTQRAFRAVCKRDPASVDQTMINRVSQEFINDNYNLEKLFARVAVSSECLGGILSP